MSGLMYIAWRYLCFHRWKAVLLTVALTLVVFLPAGLTILIDSSAEQLTARARTTPLLAGAAGSPLELTLNGLYFDESRPALTQYAEAEAIAATGLARAIPIYVRYRAGDYRIVGTTPDYQAYRDLKMASGRPVAMLGEAVLGATVARETGLGVGDSIVSSPESAFDLAGVYPLKMQIVGVLKPSLTADDDAVFTDIKTTWVIEGLGHGHQNLQKADASVVMKSDGDTVVANAALVNYNEITPENADSFHFHGDLGAYPVSAIVINPPDQKSGVLLLGRLAGQEGGVQVVRTEDVVEELLATVFRVRQYVLAAIALVGGATALLAILVFTLSIRARAREQLTMARIGGSRIAVAMVMAAEVIGVMLGSLISAAMLLWLLSRYTDDAVVLLTAL